jgi:hypothetical protein
MDKCGARSCRTVRMRSLRHGKSDNERHFDSYRLLIWGMGRLRDGSRVAGARRNGFGWRQNGGHFVEQGAKLYSSGANIRAAVVWGASYLPGAAALKERAVRDEQALRLCLISALDPTQAREVVLAHLAEAETATTELCDLARTADADSHPRGWLRSGRLALDSASISTRRSGNGRRAHSTSSTVRTRRTDDSLDARCRRPGRRRRGTHTTRPSGVANHMAAVKSASDGADDLESMGAGTPGVAGCETVNASA